MEFRTRPKGKPELRIWIGEPKGRADKRELEAVRDSLKAIARAEHWDTLRKIRAGKHSALQVHAAYRARGIEGYRVELRDSSPLPTLGEAMEEFLATVPHLGTRKAYRSAGRRVLELLGEDTSIGLISSHSVNEMIRTVSGKYTPWYRQKLITVGSALFSYFIEKDKAESRAHETDRSLIDNPFREAKPVFARSTRHRFLLREEYYRLLNTVNPVIRAMYAASVWGALRSTELLHLRPLLDVDLPARKVRIQPHPDWSPKGWPKSDRGVRDIPIHQDELLPILEEHWEKYAGDEVFFLNPRTGQPWGYQAWKEQVKKDVTAAGLVYGSRDPMGVTTHTFRHTVPSWMAAQDIQMKKIADFMGNTVRICEAHYTHLLPGTLDETIHRL